MRALYTADLHLTSLPDDEYRWGVIPWLEPYVANENLDCLWIIGDLTDRKDEHPSELVNRLCDGLDKLAQFCPVYIVRGNHDYVDEAQPFFRFIDRHPGIRFFNVPTTIKIKGMRVRVMPHSRPWRRYWLKEDLSGYDRVIFHQAIQGAVGSNGHALSEGMPISRFASMPEHCRAIGGDIHRPQKNGRTRYVGSPHPIYFGDDFIPGALLETDDRFRFIEHTTLRKVSLNLDDVEQLAETDLTEGDRARVTVRLPRSEFVHWDRHKARLREIAEERGLALYAVKLAERGRRVVLKSDEPKESKVYDQLATFDRFIHERDVDDSLAAAGRQLLED